MSSTLLTLERPAGRRKHSELLNGHTGTNGAALKVCFITREYPPNVYGGAGVHIMHLARELAQVMDVEVRCFGDQDLTEGRLRVKGYQPWGRMAEGAEQRFNSVLGTFSTDLSIVRDPLDAIVHAHTWYAAMAGFMAKELYDVPFVVTVHSLEPFRPWKEEQLGRSYHLSTWIERVALEAADRVIAVSSQSKGEILTHFNIPPELVTVIHNGIDLATWKPSPARATRQAYDIDGDYILFVGRICRQKGMIHLLEAMKYVAPGVRLVCCAAAADTPEVEQEIAAKVKETPRCLWINSWLREEQYIELYSHCAVFACHVGVRAVRHHQPRGDGLRAAGGGQRRGRHPRGRGPRGDGPARAAGRPQGAGRRAQPRPARPCRGQRHGPRRPPARRGTFLLDHDRRPDTPHVPGTAQGEAHRACAIRFVLLLKAPRAGGRGRFTGKRQVRRYGKRAGLEQREQSIESRCSKGLVDPCIARKYPRSR
jgi:starch synthase